MEKEPEKLIISEQLRVFVKAKGHGDDVISPNLYSDIIDFIFKSKEEETPKEGKKCSKCNGQGFTWNELYQHNPPSKIPCDACSGKGFI